nr:uncharacterized protein LOC111429318 [Onthophagus taurus]
MYRVSIDNKTTIKVGCVKHLLPFLIDVVLLKIRVNAFYDIIKGLYKEPDFALNFTFPQFLLISFIDFFCVTTKMSKLSVIFLVGILIYTVTSLAVVGKHYCLGEREPGDECKQKCAEVNQSPMCYQRMCYCYTKLDNVAKKKIEVHNEEAPVVRSLFPNLVPIY